MNFLNVLLASLPSLGLSGFLYYLFQESLKAKLKKSVDEGLARVQHELDVKKELLKNELTREAYRAELSLKNVHAIYPELASKLEHANGAVLGLQGVGYRVNIDRFNAEELTAFVVSRKFPQLNENRLLAEIEANLDRGRHEVKTFVRQQEFDDARRQCNEAKNYRILKSFYCSTAVLEAFDDCHQTIWNAWADMDVGKDADPALWTSGSNTIRKEVPPKIETFRQAIRAELRVDRT